MSAAENGVILAAENVDAGPGKLSVTCVNGNGEIVPAPPTTTISTIAVQAGNARIVIALLQSKEWLQLKILEMEPDLSKIGTTSEEALEFQRQHEDVLIKLQGKQSPVEELLNQADQLISTQKPRAEVYAAMAESLGLAWRDLNNQLEHRKQLLEQSVAFHTRAREFSTRLDRGEKECVDTILPAEPEVIRRFLQQHHDMKKGILEASMHTLNEGQVLLDKLREVAALGTGDSRPGQLRQNANIAIYHVELLMETLHDRRRKFEDQWTKRKLILEQCLQLGLLYSDFAQVNTWLEGKGQEYTRNSNLGESSASAEIIQHEHGKIEIEAKQVQDRSIRLLRTAEQLHASGHYGGPEAESRAYQTLNACTDFADSVDNRRILLALAVAFFRLAHSALTKLDQIEVQLSTSHQPGGQLAKTIDEITASALHEGHQLLERLDRNDSGVQGVARTVNELETRKENLSSRCVAHQQQNEEKSAVIRVFEQSFNSLYMWLMNNGQAYLQGHQDMGSVLSMAKEFLQGHEQLFKDVVNKGPELEALLRSVPNLLRNAPAEDAGHVEEQIENLRGQWMAVNATLESRIQLTRLYVNFHRLAVQLANDIDDLESVIVGIRDGSQTMTDASSSAIEERWLTIQQQWLQMKNTGKNFIFDARRTKDPYLDVPRAVLCVETLLEHFQSRLNQLANLRTSFETQVTQNTEIRTLIEKYIVDVRKTVTWITNIQLDLYPAITGNVLNVQSIIWELERKMDNFMPSVRKAQSEIESHLKSSENLILKDGQGEKDKILSELTASSQRLNTWVNEYQLLLNILIAYFKKILELEKMVKKMEMQYSSTMMPTGVNELEVMIKEHEASRHAVIELFKFSINERAPLVVRIHQQEPEVAARLDEEKLVHVVDLIQQHWEKSWQEHKQHLEQHMQLCQFNQDLRQINNQLNELSTQLANIRGNYGESLPAARGTSQAFVQFEKTIELLEQRIRVFVSTAEKMLSDDHMEKHHIKFEIGNLQTKWSTFHMQVGENRKLIDLTIEYFKLVDEAEEWFKEGSRLLIQIARKSTTCHSQQDANNLLNEVQNFLRPGRERQELRLRKITELATHIYGNMASSRVDTVSLRNREMLDSFTAINEELNCLSVNLKTAQQDKEKQLKEREEADAALVSAKAEAAAARASAVAADVARKASEAATITSSSSIVEERVLFRELRTSEAVPTPTSDGAREAARAPAKPLSPPVLVDEKLRHVAPIFVTPLCDAEVAEGARFTFTCRVTAFPPAEVRWFKDGIAIADNPDYRTTFEIETGRATLTIEETFSEDSARFSCQAGNAAGIVETVAKLTVKELRPVEEYVPPHFEKELLPGSAKVGSPFEFVGHVTGNPLPVVTWSKNDTCIDNSPDYVITFNNGTCILRFEDVVMTDDAIYSCKASNDVGSATSSANLLVEAAEHVESPSFPQPLSNVMARAGQKLRLECRVVGIPEPQVTWLHNNRPVKDTRDAKVTSDGDKVILTIAEAFPKDAGTYVVVAKNRAGEATSACTVTVKGRLPLETSDSELASDMEPVKPRILQLLKDMTSPENRQIRMDCVIIGQPEPEVIWYHDSVPVKESKDFQLLFEGDTCSLIIREAIAEDAGQYKVVAINSAGEASSACQLRIKSTGELLDLERTRHNLLISVEKASTPKFSRLLTDVAVDEGDPLLLQCSVGGDPEPVVVWYKDGREIGSGNGRQITHEKWSGGHSVRLLKVRPTDAGTYTVRASNAGGEAKCLCHVAVNPSPPGGATLTRLFSGATPTASTPPIFERLFSDRHVPRGQPVRFECRVTGIPRPKVQWYFKGEPVTAKDFTITVDGEFHVLSLASAGPEDSGRFSCTAENERGKATCAAMLQVDEPAELIIDEFGQLVHDSTSSVQRLQSSSVTKSSTVMQKSFSSSTSEIQSGGKVEFHQVAAQEEHALHKVNDKTINEHHLSKKEEVHRVKASSSLVSESTVKSVTSGKSD